jgi:hypothetical protein
MIITLDCGPSGEGLRAALHDHVIIIAWLSTDVNLQFSALGLSIARKSKIW